MKVTSFIAVLSFWLCAVPGQPPREGERRGRRRRAGRPAGGGRSRPEDPARRSVLQEEKKSEEKKMVRLSPLASPAATWRDRVTARPPLTPTGGPRESVEHGGLGAGRGTSHSTLSYSGVGGLGGARVNPGGPETDSTSTPPPAPPLLRLRNQHHHHRRHHHRLHHRNHLRHQIFRILPLRRQFLRLVLTLTR
jgi:hypothetical protein